MAVSTFSSSSVLLTILLITVLLPAAVDSQRCDQPINDYQNCLSASSSRRSDSPPQEPSKSSSNTFQEMKNKIDQCFTRNHCKAPEFGPGGGSAGGSTSRTVRQAPQRFDENAARKCLQIVNNKTRDYMFACMRKADPTFNFNGAGARGAGASRRRRRREAANSKGGFRSPQDPQFLLRACDNNAAAATKVNACLADVFPPNHRSAAAADQEKLKQSFQRQCQAKKTCQTKYLTAACQRVLEKRNEAVCACGNELHDKRQQFLEQESSCKNVLQMQRQRQGESSGPGRAQRQDCTRRSDYCEQGFDAMIKARGQN